MLPCAHRRRRAPRVDDFAGIGCCQLPLVGPGTFDSQALLPPFADALRHHFNDDETVDILGGNYQRVFEASLG
jgi:membrane dipeptidase